MGGRGISGGKKRRETYEVRIVGVDGFGVSLAAEREDEGVEGGGIEGNIDCLE